MGLFVTTTGSDVAIEELGITIVDPAVDFDLTGQFTPEELKHAESLTTAITGGVLIWKKSAGGLVIAAGDYDPDVTHADEANTGTGDQGDRVVTFKDLLNNGPNGGGPIMFTGSGNIVSGDSLSVGRVPSDRTGLVIKGSNSVVSITVSNETNVSTNDAVGILTRRTAVSTFVDVAGTEITLPIGQYKATGSFDLLLPDDPELGFRLTDVSGNLKNPVFLVQLRYNGASAP